MKAVMCRALHIGMAGKLFPITLSSGATDLSVCMIGYSFNGTVTAGPHRDFFRRECKTGVLD